MTPNDLDQYLAVLVKHPVGSAAIKLPTGAEIHVSFVLAFPAQAGTAPEPGGWKSPQHLDDPGLLHITDEGTLPS